MIRTLLFATDFSPFSKEVLGYALGVAEKTRTKMIGAYALKVSIPTYNPTELSPARVDELRHSARAKVNAFFASEKAEGGVDLETRLVEGVPEQVLNELAQEVKADLIVVGRHSRSTLERFFVGSTTERILRQASCPVLVVPEQNHRSVRWKPILCGVDFSHASKDALHFSIELTRNYDADLAVIHVVDQGVDENVAGETLRSHLEVVRQRVDKDLRELLQTRGASAATRAVVLEGKIAQAIIEAAERMGSDLIVVGGSGQAPSETVSVGTTTNAILRRSPIPILVVV